MPYNHHAHPPYATNMNTLVKRFIKVIVEAAKLHCHLQYYGSPIAIRLEARVFVATKQMEIETGLVQLDFFKKTIQQKASKSSCVTVTT